MKHVLYGRVLAQTLFAPNPRDYPDIECGKVALALQPLTNDADKSTKAVIVVAKDDLWEDFVLGRRVRITIEDEQQELALERGGAAAGGNGKKPEASAAVQTTVTLQAPRHQPVTTTLEGMEQAADALRGAGRRSRANTTRH